MVDVRGKGGGGEGGEEGVGVGVGEREGEEGDDDMNLPGADEFLPMMILALKEVGSHCVMHINTYYVLLIITPTYYLLLGEPRTTALEHKVPSSEPPFSLSIHVRPLQQLESLTSFLSLCNIELHSPKKAQWGVRLHSHTVHVGCNFS